MNIRHINVLLLSGFMLIGASVSAQENPVVITSSVNWNYPEITCQEKPCWIISNTDRNAVLYINNVHEKRLYVVKPDGSLPTLLDLTEVTKSVFTSIFGEFVPFEDGSIVFDGYSTRGYQLFLYDTLSNQASPLNISWPGRLTKCESHIIMPWRNFYRLGIDKRIIACSISDDYLYQINIVNVSTLSIERTIHTQYKFSPFPRPWIKLQGGDDGNLYVQLYSGNISSLSQDRPQGEGIDPDASFYVARYNPSDNSWEVISIPKLLESRVSVEDPLRYSIDKSLFAVDEAGNMYCSLVWSNGGESLHTDTFKLDSEGYILWHLTEADLDGIKYFRGLVQADMLFVKAANGTGSGDEIIQIQNLTATGND